MSEIVDTTAEEVGTDLERAHTQPPTTLFGTDNPAEVIVRASAVAAALKDVLTAQKMVQRIQNKDYVKVEGWQTLGSMLGVVPVVVWTRPVDGGWEARVEARTVDGRTVGAAESMCTESEGGNWGPRASSNARRSMAQTRAVSKALRGPLGFVVTLAGYQSTPADEMQHMVDTTPAHDPSPLVDAEEAASITQRIGAAMGAGLLDAPGLAALFHKSGARPERVNGEAVTKLTVLQAMTFHDTLTKLGFPRDAEPDLADIVDANSLSENS